MQVIIYSCSYYCWNVANV